MPRKSHDLRLSQAVNLLESYEAASHRGGEVSFVRDMIGRMQRRKQMSAKQRNWLDSLIEQGVPAPKGNTALIEEIERLLKVTGTDHVRDTLSDFLFREKKGWTLSPKQIAFRDRLMDEARDIERDGPWNPSSEQAEKLRSCVAMAPSRSQVYWSTHPGEQKAVAKVIEWLSEETPFVDEWSVLKVIHSFRSGLRELENPYASTGDIVWGNHGNFYGLMALVTGGPEIDKSGRIKYPVLIDGVSEAFSKGMITKRRPKKKADRV
jgi:hypothetical protein